MEYFIIVAEMRVSLPESIVEAENAVEAFGWSKNDIQCELVCDFILQPEPPVEVVSIEKVGMDVIAIEEAA